MGLITSTNIFFALHRSLFLSILLSVLAIIFVLFTWSLVHVLVGVRYTFVVMLHVAVLQSIVCYSIYSYQYIIVQRNFHIWHFLSVSSFGIYHWLLSQRYLRSSLEMNYVLNNLQIPPRNKFFEPAI